MFFINFFIILFVIFFFLYFFKRYEEWILYYLSDYPKLGWIFNSVNHIIIINYMIQLFNCMNNFILRYWKYHKIKKKSLLNILNFIPYYLFYILVKLITPYFLKKLKFFIILILKIILVFFLKKQEYFILNMLFSWKMDNYILFYW